MRASVFAGWLAVVFAGWLAGCTISGGSRTPAAPAQPTDDLMPSAVLERQDPGADTSQNPELSRSSSRSLLGELLGGLSPWRAPAPAFAGPTEAPHYYKGCRGCGAERPGGLAELAVAAAAAAALGLGRQRRRPRPLTASKSP